jgi:1-acyl-sn-glycerol-3-phosphate acyltransferase
VVYALILFGVMLIIVFLLALPASLLGTFWGGNVIYMLCRTWTDVLFWAVGIRHENIYEHRPERGAPCIFVANHRSYLDAALIPKAVRWPVRPLGKIELTRKPLFGFIYSRVIVVVDRSDPEARAESVQKLMGQLRRGISIFMFPEGTVNKTGELLGPFYDGAFRMAIETQCPVQPILFLDASARFNRLSVFSLNPGRSRAIFLEPVPVIGRTMEGVGALRDEVHARMDEGLKRYKADWLK